MVLLRDLFRLHVRMHGASALIIVGVGHSITVIHYLDIENLSGMIIYKISFCEVAIICKLMIQSFQ